MNIATLTAECTAWRALRDALLAEEHALIEGETDDLEGLATRKQTCLDSLGDYLRLRRAALIGAGHSSDAEGMTAWLAEADAETRALWRKLEVLEAETRAINQRNGGLLAQRMQRVRLALNLLRGGGDATLYDRSGRNTAPWSAA